MQIKTLALTQKYLHSSTVDSTKRTKINLEKVHRLTSTMAEEVVSLLSSDTIADKPTSNMKKSSKDVDRSIRDTRLKLMRDPCLKLTFNKGFASLLFCLFCVLFVPRLGGNIAAENNGAVSSSSSISSASKNNNKKCNLPGNKKKGIIISNLLGRIGNNILEIGFANLLAKELCWPVVYRVMWTPTFPSKRSKQCFPNALMAMSDDDSTVVNSVKESLSINETLWETAITFDVWNGDAGPPKQVYNEWLATLLEHGKAWRCEHLQCDYSTGDAFLQDTVASLQTGARQIVSLSAFFVHYEWMRHHMDDMRHWFQINPACCPTHPPADAIVIHYRNFKEGDHGIKNVPWNVSVYESIIDRYDYQGRPVWVVCEPRTADAPSALLDALKEKLNAQIYTGVDEFDAHCILQQARVLILSTSSTFSQTAALLSHHGDTNVHYPTYGFHHPKVTLKVPGWKYHLVDKPHESAKHKIIDFDMNHSKIVVRHADP